MNDFQTVIEIGTTRVGPGHPCYVIAEAGSNHDGDLDAAFEMIDAAADAGADAVKFQVFRPEDLVTRIARPASYLGGLMEGKTTLFELFAKTAMDRAWLPRLAERARAHDIDFLATPFDDDAVDRLASPAVAVPAMKNASSELWHLPLIRRAAATGLPMLLSTGMADLADIDDAVEAVRETGACALALFQCTVTYPAPAEAVNLRAMETLRARYRVPVGLSDHTLGTWAPIAAVALGANLIEKHFTLSRTRKGPDHPYAIEPGELASMITAIRSAEHALGDGEKKRQASEEEIYNLGRRNVVATRDLTPGKPLSESDLAILRSPLGIAPKHLPELLGRSLARAIAAGSPVQWSDLVAQES